METDKTVSALHIYASCNERNQVYTVTAKTFQATVLEEAHAHPLCVSSPSEGISF